MERTRIILAGEGGQGIQTIAKILATATAASGKKVSYMPSFGVEQRGTPSVAFIVMSDFTIRSPKFDTAEFVVILQERAIKRISEFLSPNSSVIFDSSTVPYAKIPKIAQNRLAIPATKLAYEKFNPKSFNIIMLGALVKLFSLDKVKTWETILAVLGKKFKTEEIKKQNYDAFVFGYEAVLETKQFSPATFVTSHENIYIRGNNKSAEISPTRCKGCGICIVKCPVGALSFSHDLGVYATPIPQIDLEKCIACGNCKNFCPDGAIIVSKNS